MIYIYDILLNFIDGNRIYEFFEWDKTDIIEHIKRIPLYYIDTNTMNDLINKQVIVEEQFLKEIKDRTLIFTDTSDRIIKYACLFTNKEKCYGFEFDDNGNILYSSSLLLDEEEEILEVSKNMDKYTPKYKVLNTSTKDMILTRKEENKKNFIKRDLSFTYDKKDYTKLSYLYTECFGYDNSSYKEKYDRLMKAIEILNSKYRNKLNFILKLSHKSIASK